MAAAFKAPKQFYTEESEEYEQSVRKFIEPTKRRARRHFDEELAFFTDRLENWLGCRGSNHDFADFSEEQRTLAKGLHRGLLWLRISYADHLMDKCVKLNASYVPHDWRPKVKAVRDYIIEIHNNGKGVLTKRAAKLHNISRKDVTRDFKLDDQRSRSTKAAAA